jgi:hypothetical protein
MCLQIRNTTQPGFVPTSVKQISNLPLAGINPNPSSGKFSITVNDDRLSSSVDILNLAGRIVYTSSLNNYRSDIDLSTEPDDIYFMQILSSGGTTTQKLVVAR